ncbi:hypothetical protein JTB14_036630 [Gonioctena quinquepunctata]|nr:hypothetical protein JTB14_036630 [Gonioctena quinquepunctata]
MNTTNVNKSIVLELPFSARKACESEVFYLKEIIKQKDMIIQNQSDLVCSLKEQIILLNKVLKSENPNNILDNGHISPSTSQYLNRNVTSGGDLRAVSSSDAGPWNPEAAEFNPQTPFEDRIKRIDLHSREDAKVKELAHVQETEHMRKVAKVKELTHVQETEHMKKVAKVKKLSQIQETKHIKEEAKVKELIHFQETKHMKKVAKVKELTHVQETEHMKKVAKVKKLTQIQETEHIKEEAKVKELTHFQETKHMKKVAKVKELTHVQETEHMKKVTKVKKLTHIQETRTYKARGQSERIDSTFKRQNT